MRKIVLYVALFALAFSACVPSSKEKEKSTRTSWSRITADSLKYEYTWKGDTLHTDVTDLRETRGDDFDDSFNVISTFDTVKCHQVNGTRLTVLDNQVQFSFLLDSLKNFCAKRRCAPWVASNANHTIVLDGSEDDRYALFDIVDLIPGEVKILPKGKQAQKVVIEHYETSFSGGNRYFFLGAKGDTLAQTSINHWMR